MADVNRGDRPLSPHLSIYRPQWTSLTSIAHRVTGAALTVSALLVVWWLFAAATSAEAFATADALLTSALGDLVLFLSLGALAYHTCNGVRHLIWDTGRGLDLPSVEKSGPIVVGAAAALTLLVLFLV